MMWLSYREYVISILGLILLAAGCLVEVAVLCRDKI